MSILGSILKGFSPVVDSSLSKIASSSIESAFRKNEINYNHQLMIDRWNMQNEYNLPINQVKRLEDAGLNPALAYGNTANLAGGFSSSGSSAPYGDQLDIVGKRLAIAQNEANVANTNANTELTLKDSQLRERDIVLREKEALHKDLQIVNQSIHNAKDDAERLIAERERDNIQERLRLINENIASDTQTKQSQAYFNFMSAFERFESGKLHGVQRELMRAQINEIGSKIGLNSAQTIHFLRLAKLNKWNVLAEQYRAALRMVGIDPDDHSWQTAPARLLGRQLNEQILNYVYRGQNTGEDWLHKATTPQAYPSSPTEVSSLSTVIKMLKASMGR